MWATLLNNQYWALDGRFVAVLEPIIHKALNGGKFDLPIANQLKSFDSKLSDENGNMVPFVALSTVDTVEGKPRANSQSMNVAVIPVRGTLMKNGIPIMGGLCGSSMGTTQIAQLIQEAFDNPDISAVVLYTEGPGGGVDGIEKLARTIYNKNKPVVAYVDGLAASATYWGICTSDQIFISEDKTAFVGSIGILCTSVNESKSLEQQGISVEIIRDSTSPEKARENSIEPLSDSTRSDINTRLADMKSTFVNWIIRGRGERIKDESVFTTGKVYNGGEAVKNGLVDKIGTLQDAVNAAAKLASKPQDSNPNNSNKKKMKVNANVTPLLASAMAFAAEQTEAEIEETNLVALESHLSSQAAALSEAQTAITAAVEAKATAEATVKASEAELNTLREWKKSAGNIHIRQEDEGNDDTSPVEVPAYNQEAMDAYDQIHGKKKKK